MPIPNDSTPIFMLVLLIKLLVLTRATTAFCLKDEAGRMR